MFKKRKNPKVTIIGSDAKFEGNITVNGWLQIEGSVDGIVESKSIVSISQNGKVQGTLRAQEVAVAGHFKGDATVNGRLHILSTGSFMGDVHYQKLQIDCGGYIEGKTERIAETAAETAQGAITSDNSERVEEKETLLETEYIVAQET